MESNCSVLDKCVFKEDQMRNRKTISVLLSLCMALTMAPMTAFADTAAEAANEAKPEIRTFSDVNGHWASEAIYKWAGLGIIKGDDKGFRPNDSITRAELAAILDNLMEYQKKAGNQFVDVKDHAWYADAVLKANAAGILNGDGAGHAAPTAKITREQAAVMLGRAFGTDENQGNQTLFQDKAEISSWAQSYVFGMESDQYIGGMGNGNFEPKANITRAQVVTIIDNAVRAYYTKAGTYTENVMPKTDGANCVAIVKTDGITIKNAEINGDLIVAEGVEQGNFTLDGATVAGKLIARGGGKDSIHVINGAAVNGRVSIERVDGAVRIVSDGVVIANLDASTEVILEGDFTNVTVAEGAAVEVRGQVANIQVEAKAEVTVSKEAKVDNLTVDKGAEGAKVRVAGTVANMKTEAPKTEVVATDTAKITKMETTATAAGTDINIDKKAEIKTLDSASAVTTSGEGSPKAVTGSGTVTHKGSDSAAQSGNGSSGGGGGGGPTGNSGGIVTPSITSATIKGVVRVNAVLSADTVSSGTVGTLTYQWYRSSTNGAINTASDTAIGTAAAYRLLSEDKDNYIYYKVSGTGSLQKYSGKAGPVGEAAVPAEKVTNLTFADTDYSTAEIGGTLSWTAPSDVSNVTEYHIYSSADGNTTGTSITTAAVGTNQIVIPENTALIDYLVVVCSNLTGEATTFTAIEVTDTLPRNQDAPTGLTGVAPTAALNDGKITGVTTAMEYKAAANTTYSAVTGTAIYGLIAGDYHVRYAARDGYNAGATTTVTVPVYVPKKHIATLQSLGYSYTDDSGAALDFDIDGFVSATTSYAVTIYDPYIDLNKHISLSPVVTADSNAEITENLGINLDADSGTAIVLVTAEDGVTTKQYEVSFGVERRSIWGYCRDADFVQGHTGGNTYIVLEGTTSSGVECSALALGDLTVTNNGTALSPGDDYSANLAYDVIIFDDDYLNSLSVGKHTIQISIKTSDGVTLSCTQDIYVVPTTAEIYYTPTMDGDPSHGSLQVYQYTWADENYETGSQGDLVSSNGGVVPTGGVHNILITGGAISSDLRVSSMAITESYDDCTAYYDETFDFVRNGYLFWEPYGTATIDVDLEPVPSALPHITGIELYGYYNNLTEEFSDPIEDLNNDIKVGDRIFARYLFADGKTCDYVDGYLDTAGSYRSDLGFMFELGNDLSGQTVTLHALGIDKYCTGDVSISFYVNPDTSIPSGGGSSAGSSGGSSGGI